MDEPTDVSISNFARSPETPASVPPPRLDGVGDWKPLKLAMSPARLAPALSKQAIESRDAAEKTLWYWNLSCAIAHGGQAVAALILALLNFNGTIGNFKLPLTTTFLDWSPERGFPVQNLQRQAELPFAAVASGFAFLSMFAHLTVLAFYKIYISDLRRGINRFRWIEYAFSSSLMIALIAMLFGIYDVFNLVLIMSLNACMNLFGYLHESMNQYSPSVDWTAFGFGCFAGVVPWCCVLAAVLGIPNRSLVPAFVWALIGVYFVAFKTFPINMILPLIESAVYFVAFNTFPINMILQYKKVGRFADKLWPGEFGNRRGGGSGYYYGERWYQIQSLVSKSLLLWLVIGGVNQPNPYTG